MSVRTRARRVYWSRSAGLLSAGVLAALVIGGAAALLFGSDGSAVRPAAGAPAVVFGGPVGLFAAGGW